MIINYLDINRTCLRPQKADPILVIYPDTVLTPAISSESLQPVSRRHSKILERLGLVEGIKSPSGHLPERPRQPLAGSLGIPSVKQVLGNLVTERPDHSSIIARVSCYCSCGSPDLVAAPGAPTTR